MERTTDARDAELDRRRERISAMILADFFSHQRLSAAGDLRRARHVVARARDRMTEIDAMISQLRQIAGLGGADATQVTE